MYKIFFVLLVFLVLGGPLKASAQLRVPPLEIKERTLANGLRVITHRDASSPTVAVRVLYDVGGKNDPPGRSGFAHMFEHMMFKSTKNMPNEKMDRLTEDVGGYNNASTWPDFTNYYQVVPSNYLESILWAESDRMVDLNVDEENFASERDVVKEEYRQGVLANPYGRFFQMLDGLSFQKHPYRRGVIGNLEELDAASREDAERFYREFYRPDNAVLFVVGDFEPAQLDRWVDHYFAPIKRPEGTIPRVTTTEPDWTEERRFEETGPIVPFPAVAITFLAPPSRHPDVPALQIAESILSDGESSRLYQALVRELQIAQQAQFSADIRVDKGLLYFIGVASEKGTSESMERALLAEINKMQEAPVSAKELEKAKNQLITRAIRQRENNDGRAAIIERAVAYLGDPNAVNEQVARLQAVTAEDVQRVMKVYFRDNNRVVIYYNQARSAEGNNEQ
ncbi:MAG TPA: pitrilysin family protein [Pyrinomonadaceae bacterium]|nr:pitrilysin family protein [Pyrinomonadaceae bacterium]HMP64988.1 pitrilysin family protein [Pyrinomonadaceae bacterium]